MKNPTLLVITIVVIIFFIGVIVWALLWNKPPEAPPAPKTCQYDSDCLDPSYTCIKKLGNAATGTCSNACLLPGDCWHGNPKGTATCSQNIGGQNICTLQPCTTISDCTSGEACITSGSQSYCVTLGLEKTQGVANMPLPCNGATCYGKSSGLLCETLKSQPVDTLWPCKLDSDCPNGLQCDKTSGGYCTKPPGVTGGLAYCVQCSQNTDCPISAPVCTNGYCNPSTSRS